MKNIFSKARKGQLTQLEADRFFACADQANEIMSKESFVRNTIEVPPLKNELDKMYDRIFMIIAARTPKDDLGDEIQQLATLRQKGLISDMEFTAFSERFTLTTGEKASGIINAISKLSEQRKQGAMEEGNYHAALWSLLDKLDRKT